MEPLTNCLSNIFVEDYWKATFTEVHKRLAAASSILGEARELAINFPRLSCGLLSFVLMSLSAQFFDNNPAFTSLQSLREVLLP